jgi:hypothetical protein
VAAQPELQRGRFGVQVAGLLDAVLLVQVAEEGLGAVDDLVVGVGGHGDPSVSNVCSSIAAPAMIDRPGEEEADRWPTATPR